MIADVILWTSKSALKSEKPSQKFQVVLVLATSENSEELFKVVVKDYENFIIKIMIVPENSAIDD